jgi:hypothetical protein
VSPAVRFAVVLLAALAAPVAASDREPDFEGVWKLCYEADLNGVKEIVPGYLVLLPGGTYHEQYEPCCSGSVRATRGTYTVLEGEPTFVELKEEGSSCASKIRYQPEARVVYHDDIYGPPVVAEALVQYDDLNFSWCRTSLKTK